MFERKKYGLCNVGVSPAAGDGQGGLEFVFTLEVTNLEKSLAGYSSEHQKMGETPFLRHM